MGDKLEAITVIQTKGNSSLDYITSSRECQRWFGDRYGLKEKKILNNRLNMRVFGYGLDVKCEKKQLRTI